VFVIINIYKNYKLLPTLSNLISIALTPLLTVIFIPYIYILALYCMYESLFVRVRFLERDIKKQRKTRKWILIIANININKLNNVSRNLVKSGIYDATDISELIKIASQPSE